MTPEGMTPESQNWLDWAFKALVVGAGALGMNVLKDTKKDFKVLENSINFLKDDVVRNYATKPDLNLIRVETNQSLERIHKRIDEGNEKAEQNFKETRSDINEVKNLLIDRNGDK